MVIYQQVSFDVDGLFLEEFFFPELPGLTRLIKSRVFKEVSDELLSSS